MKSSARSYLLNLLIYVCVVNEISIPTVTCQEEENYQCLPRRTFFALLRLPKVTSNVAAWSRKYRDDIEGLKGFTTEDNLSPEVCLPADVYLDLFGNSGFLNHLRALVRAQEIYRDPTSQSNVPIDKLDASTDRDEDEEEDDEEDDAGLDSEKRSLATLAKNGDLPISIRYDKPKEEEVEEEEEKKRSPATLVHVAPGTLLNRKELEELLQLSEMSKRNVAALARDFALPSGKRNVAALARDFALPQSNSGKRNVAALARDFALPSSSSGKRNVAALARDFALPYGKRNIAALARDFSLPYGKRYLDIFSRFGTPRFQYYEDGKRNIASLVRNGDLPSVGYKRNVAALARDWTLPKQYRFGRSLEASKFEERKNIGEENRSIITQTNNAQIVDTINEKKLEALAAAGNSAPDYDKIVNKNRKIDGDKLPIGNNGERIKRPKRQIEFSDEYPLPVMQNDNVLDYEEMIEALTGEYPNAEKRFMAGEPMEMQDMEEKEDPIFSAPAAKRHIGALARLGWLPSFRASRFSRSPRYLVNRENSADGTSADYPADSSSRSLGLLGRTTRYSRSQNFGDCRHGFKRFLVLPSSPLDKLFSHKLYRTQRTA